MTEYEIADLAISNQEAIMHRIDIIQEYGNGIANGIEIFMTAIFGYLVAAYFIGPNLNKAQVLVLTALYIVFQTLNIIGIMGTAQAWLISVGLLAEAAPTMPLPNTLETKEPTNLAMLSLLVGSTLASLYFMWTVRHPKTE